MLRLLRASGRDRGATALEYALMLGAITLVIVFGAIVLGQAVDNPFTDSAACAADRTQC
jgi:Flp pilus assembly pilin Flp